MTLRLRLLRAWLRAVEKPALARIPGPPEIRTRFERTARWMFRDPPYALYQQDALAGRPAQWAGVGACERGVVLYFHGGAYIFGSPLTHRAMLAELSRLTGLKACLPQYRLAPEHPFPAALDDAVAAWDALIARGYPPHRIALGGDSAGGGLMLALLAQLCQRGGALPAAAFAFSPYTDQTLSGASMIENASSESVLPSERVSEARDYYLDGADPTDPRASPLFARFPGCPPVFLQAASTEILRDDSLRMAEVLREQGVKVELDLWDDLPHVWPIFQGRLPEADEALRRVARFLRAQPAVTSR